MHIAAYVGYFIEAIRIIYNGGGGEEALVSVRAALVPELVWTLWRNGKSLILPGIE